MTHEPECLWLHGGDCGCYFIQVGYQRGREDAAKAVEELAADFGDSDWQLTVHASAVAHGIEMALAAARGGEQE